MHEGNYKSKNKENLSKFPNHWEDGMSCYGAQKKKVEVGKDMTSIEYTQIAERINNYLISLKEITKELW